MITARALWRAGGSCQRWRNIFNVSALDLQRRPVTLQTRKDSDTQAEHPPTYNPHRRAQQFDLDLLVSILREENARDLCVIKIPPELKYADHMIIASGTSSRHLCAMSELLLKAFKFLRHDGEQQVRLEGRDCDDWKCMDFGSMVIHLMLPDTRDTYELEKLWMLRSYDEQLQRLLPENLPLELMDTHSPEQS